MTADNLYHLLLQSMTRQQIESTCRQVLSLCDREALRESERLKAQAKALLEKRRKESEPDWLDAPGYFAEDGTDLSRL